MHLILLLACAARQIAPGGDPGPVFLEVAPEAPRLCVSSAPAAGPLPDADGWRGGLALLQARQPGASAALQQLAPHPGVEAAVAAAALVEGRVEEARVALRDLANTWREDACLQQAAGFAMMRAGSLRAGAAFAAAAVDLAPDQPDFLLLDGMARRLDGEMAGPTESWRRVLALQPGQPQASALLAGDYLARGEAALALPHLEDAMAGGVDVSALLAPAYFQAGRLGDYVRVASRAGWPLGDGGALADADDPAAAFAAMLGVGEGQALYATIRTSMGDIRCELFWRDAPVTVGNLVGLARGTQAWTDPRTKAPGAGPYYDDTTVHRAIPEFMIQLGDPTGTGSGTPGYRFPDELVPSLRFDRPGVMGMANNGPDANGGQFFITETPARHLDGKHTIFGQCDDAGVAVVRAIARVRADAMDKPLAPVAVETIRFAAE